MFRKGGRFVVMLICLFTVMTLEWSCCVLAQAYIAAKTSLENPFTHPAIFEESTPTERKRDFTATLLINDTTSSRSSSQTLNNKSFNL